MNPGIFPIQDNEELVEMNGQAYDSEKLLQSWLAKYPALLGWESDRRQGATTKLEGEIDQLAYKLYELTDDEIAIVEGRA